MIALFSATLFLSAFLLFLIQPMFAKMILPRLGGTPEVWNTCVVFFQTALFAGYVYAHASIRWLGVRRQALLHLALLLVPLAFLPIGLPESWVPPASSNPVGWLLMLLAALVGLPFVMVSTNAPLLQRWFADTPHPSSDDPFFLYAASNLGSLGALLAYPFAVEPLLALRTQSWVWTGGYVLLILAVGACALAVLRNPAALRATGDGQQTTGSDGTKNQASRTRDQGPGTEDGPGTKAPGPRTRLHWLLLAAVPSSLMLSVTTYISTDIAAVPLMWIGPLALYLLSFVIVFARRPIIPHAIASMLLPVAVAIPLLGLLMGGTPPFWMIALHLLAFFAAALVAHGELVRTRPGAEHLTEFYLWMSAGGAIGGLFNALVAPEIFSSTPEYRYGLVAACLLRPAPSPDPKSHRFERRFGAPIRWLVYAAPILLGVLVWGLERIAQQQGFNLNPLLQAGRVYAIPLALCMMLWERPIIFGLGLAAILAGASIDEVRAEGVVYRERTFFGIHRVVDSDQYRHLYHGTTDHGSQALDPARRCEPLTYYTRSGPLGQLFASFVGPFSKYDIGLVGLGTGTSVAYSQPSQQWTIYEINPAIERIAGKDGYFSYLSSCATSANVVIGDARTSLAAAPDEKHDVIVFDAFSSDAIPIHLLTREALELYLRKLEPNGVLMFHVSNRYLDLVPVLDGLTRELHLVGYENTDRGVTPAERERGKLPSSWVVVARRVSDLGDLPKDTRWIPLTGRTDAPVWTDDYSNILSVLQY